MSSFKWSLSENNGIRSICAYRQLIERANEEATSAIIGNIKINAL